MLVLVCCVGAGLFDAQSSPGRALWRPLTHAYAHFGELMQTTPYRLNASVVGPDARRASQHRAGKARTHAHADGAFGTGAEDGAVASSGKLWVLAGGSETAGPASLKLLVAAPLELANTTTASLALSVAGGWSSVRNLD